MKLANKVCNPNTKHPHFLLWIALRIPIIIGPDLQHFDEDCWSGCNRTQGTCSWCGGDGLCCRESYIGNGCDGRIGGATGHRCVLKPGKVVIIKVI